MSEVKAGMMPSPWWLDREIKYEASPVRSPWFHSALSELDEKTKAMLRIIEEDADSFAQRAEMYYKKRPELISMVRDFYQAHRSLAERFDELKADPSIRHVTPWSLSPPSSSKNQQKQQQPITYSDKSYDSYSETYDPMESCDSDVDDPDQEEKRVQQEVLKGVGDGDEVANLRGEIEKLKQENTIQKEKLEEKDEEKREVIRQLSVAIDTLKDENVTLRKRHVIKETTKKERPYELHMLKNMFTGKLFKGSSK